MRKKTACIVFLCTWMWLAGCGEEKKPIILEAIPVVALESSEAQMDTDYKGEPLVQTDCETEESQDTIVTFTVTCAGDCSLGNHRNQDYPGSFFAEYDKNGPAYFLQEMQEYFASDDMTIVNLEGVFTDSEEYTQGRSFNIKGKPKYVDILTLGSVEAVSLGNNHRMDYGNRGLKDTIETLEQAEITYAYDDKLGIYEAKGIRVGVVSVSEASIGKRVEEYLKSGIKKLQEEEVDLILACCHWGVEKDHYPQSYQKSLGRLCIDLGADLVIGHHPHVLQGIEEYSGKYILYSLGNFSFGANKNPTEKDTMIFTQTFTFVNGVRQEDANAKVIPCRISSVSNRNDYRPIPTVGEEADRIRKRIEEFSQAFALQIREDGVITGVD